MTRFLCNDLVINEDSCNLSCRYCLTGQSNLKETHRQQLIFSPPRRDSVRGTSALSARLELVLDRFQELFDPPMLKITGGEIFLVEGIEDFIEACVARYRTVIVQTNGVVASDRQIVRLSSTVVQISLDSHTYAGNSYRVLTPAQHAKVCERISRFLDADLRVEIYAVINNRSIESLVEFARWLGALRNPPQLLPFPVRGPDANRFSARPDQLHHLDDFIALRDELPYVLPGPAYLERLRRFFREGERRFRCRLPELVATSFSDGMLTPCPNIWFSDSGRLTDEGWREAGERMIASGLRRALLADRPRIDACKRCYTPWDMLSLYLDGEIGLDDLCATPAYAGVRDILAEAWPQTTYRSTSA
jgi:MoaA/NifB/PqqE/SkfB family radical SAM enzyme